MCYIIGTVVIIQMFDNKRVLAIVEEDDDDEIYVKFENINYGVEWIKKDSNRIIKEITSLLTKEEIEELLKPYFDNHWSLVRDSHAMYKEYVFSNFIQALRFMTVVGMDCDDLNHYPEWLNVYNKVKVTLSTHDVSGLSSKDVNMATFMDEVEKFIKQSSYSVFNTTNHHEINTSLLTKEEIEELLKPYFDNHWSLVRDSHAIYKEYVFSNFIQALRFMTLVGMECDDLNHYPELLNVYNKVKVTLSTHDVSGLSSKDVNMATFMDDVEKFIKQSSYSVFNTTNHDEIIAILF